MTENGESPSGRVLELLGGPFKWLFYSNLATFVGAELWLMAQAWLILELGGSQFWVGAATGLRVIPFVMASLVAGILIDRVGGRAILIWDRLGLLLIAGITGLLVLGEVVEVVHVVALSIAAGGVLALGAPSSYTLVVELVPKDRLQVANSLNQFTFSIARAVGPMGGSFLIASLGMAAPWLALVALYAVAVLSTLKLPAVQTKPGGSAWASLVAGFKHVRSHPILSRVMLLALTLMLGSTVMPIWPVYARERFDVGSTGLGIMMGVFAVGQVISTVYVANRGSWQRLTVPILYAAMSWSAAVIVFGFSTSYPLSLAALFVMGTAVPLWVTSVATLLQTYSERGMMGRVMALYAMSTNVSLIGWLVGGWLGEWMGNDWMLLVTGAGFALLHFLIILTSREMLRV